MRTTGRDEWFLCHWEKEFSDVLLCAGLVHDIGNPPFGHFGEYAVRERFQAHLGEMERYGQMLEDEGRLDMEMTGGQTAKEEPVFGGALAKENRTVGEKRGEREMSGAVYDSGSEV